MTIKETRIGNAVTVAVSGTIDTSSSQQLADVLLALDYSNLDLTLDFAETDYITSIGLRTLLVARKKLSEDRMRVINANDSIAEVFDMTGFSQMISVSKKSAVDASSLEMSFKSLLKKKITDGVSKPVYVYGGREYTWQDIDKASQIIAADLAAMGVRKGSHVGICALNSINWIFTFYAVQKLGGIAVLVNFGLKPFEIINLSKIGSITHLCYGEIPGVTEYAAYAEAVTGSDSVIAHVYDISRRVDFTERFDEYSSVADKFDEQYHGDDASVVIFSSGSTGSPKAILSSSHNLLSCIAPLIGQYKLTGNDRNCAFLPFFHVFGFATAISAGILCDLTSYIPEDNKPATMIDVIDRNKCTTFHAVPTMVLAMTQQKNFSPERMASLRASVLGGSAATQAQMTALCALFPNNHFGNVYGMSENAAISLTPYGDSVEHVTGTVGIPVSGVELEIRDPATGAKMAKGQSGEIFIRSDTMVVCYYGLAVEKQPLDDNGWLATGDLGVIMDDGYLRLVGRAKDLIIRGGENISPGEVAEAIAALPCIADVKVVGVPHELYGEEVAAAIVLREGQSFDKDAACDFLRTRLAKFKIPVHFVEFERFPLLGSGKVDAVTIKKKVAEYAAQNK